MKRIFNLEKAFYLSIFLLPAYLVRIAVFGVPTNLWEILAIVIFFWWIIGNRNKGCVVWEKKEVRYFALGVGLLFLGFLASIWSGGVYVAGLGRLKSWFLLPLAFSWVAVDYLGRNKEKNVFVPLYWSAFSVALISLGYYALGVVTYDGRLQAFFNSPNYLAMYLSPAIFVGFYLLRKREYAKRSIAISLSIIALALFLTYSYAAWLSIVASGLCLLIISGKMKKKYLLGIVLVGLLLFFSQWNSQKLDSFLSFDERSSLASRMMIWRSAERMIESDWLWGIGLGNFQTRYLEYQKYYPPYLEWAVPHPHNLFLSFWLYGGILGLTGFLVLVFILVMKLLREKKMKTLQLVSLGILIYFLAHGLFDTTYFKNDLAVVFWLAYLSFLL